MASMNSEAPLEDLYSFEVLPSACEENARVGRLRLRGRNVVDTPNFIANSSRGTVPHISQDIMQTQKSMLGIYAAFEDYAEKLPKPFPACSIPCAEDESPLRRFIALHGSALLVMGPRRIPPVAASPYNEATTLNIFTSVGFRHLEISAYIDAVKQLRPDIVVGIADIEHGKARPSRNRADKMDERTLAWVRGLHQQLDAHQLHSRRFSALWPPILPVEPELQRSYLEYLEEQPASAFGGIALYTLDSLLGIPHHLRTLPRLMLDEPKTPHDLLTAISLGADLLIVPFVTTASEAGHAFTFTFPTANSGNSSRCPLSIDLWNPSHATTVDPLQENCTCYACTHHHAAYVHHLLNTKEMLAWVLLQLHNHHVLARFFAALRTSIAAWTFERDAEQFRTTHEDEFPEFKGEGPRIRGYHAASKGRGEPKRNHKAYVWLETMAKEKQTTEGEGKDEMRDERKEKVRESVDTGPFGDGADEFGFEQLYESGARPAEPEEGEKHS